jgi:polysaccharide chain length determinant protein (PEP-CTERM system associated)
MQDQFKQIRQFLEAIYTRRRLFIVVSAIVALLAVIITCFIPKRYEAKSTVFIERNVINSLMKDLTISPSIDDSVRVLRYYMVSRDMVTRVLRHMDMDADPRYADPEKYEGLVKKCQDQTYISFRGQDLFFISLIDPDPNFAKDYINTLVNIYVEENLSKKREESYGANRFISEQVAFYKQKLDETDTKILDFRKKTGIYSTVDEASLMAQIAKDEDALSQLKGLKTESYATIETIKEQLDLLRRRFAAGNASSLDLRSAKDRIRELQAKVDELLMVYNDQYPTVVKLREQIAELKAKDWPATPVTSSEQDNYNPIDDPIYVDLKKRLNTAQSDLNSLLAKEKELKASIKTNQALLRDFPQDKKTLNDLERERAMQAKIYDQLLQRVGVSEVSKQMEVADKAATFRIVDPAILPTKPVGKKRLLLMLIGVFGGLAAGFSAVLIAEHIDDSIKGTQDIRDLGVTVLVEIPYILSEAEATSVRKKDKATFVFAAFCTIMISLMMLHDLLGMGLIDRIVKNLTL